MLYFHLNSDGKCQLKRFKEELLFKKSSPQKRQILSEMSKQASSNDSAGIYTNGNKIFTSNYSVNIRYFNFKYCLWFWISNFCSWNEGDIKRLQCSSEKLRHLTELISLANFNTRSYHPEHQKLSKDWRTTKLRFHMAFHLLFDKICMEKEMCINNIHIKFCDKIWCFNIVWHQDISSQWNK